MHMLRINVSKDIEQFSGGELNGLTLREVAVFALVLLVSVPPFLMFYYLCHIPLTGCVFLSTPFACLTGYMGLMKKNGMTMIQYRRHMADYYKNKGKALYYVSTETAEHYNQCARQRERMTDDGKKTEAKQQLKRLMIFLISFGVLFMGTVIMIIIWKGKNT